MIVISVLILHFPYSNILILSLLTFLPIVAKFLDVYDFVRNKKFIKLAQEKLSTYKPKIIAITGSNGKTTVKNILLQLLSTKYKAQASPSSYNTPLGLSKFINNELKSDTEVIILEYGARKSGDIKKLIEIFGADFGIITSIAPQHLETFKSIENIVKEKFELYYQLNENHCVLNIDNEFIKNEYLKNKKKNYFVSTKKHAKIYAKSIKIENFKTKFKIFINNSSYDIETNLLGRHNVTNILLASAMSLILEIPIENILETVPKLNLIPHRLEFIKSHINILDDSYNCSIASAKESLFVLEQTKGKKILITPGIIEGGISEYDLNFKLGTMCKNLDKIIIVGEHNKKALTDGLNSINFHKNKIVYASTLEDASTYYQNLSEEDTILFLNDLPDDYH